MTTFAEMEALVIGQTRRPEIQDTTRAAIRSATLRAHHTDFFNRDLASSVLTYTPSNSEVFYDFANVSSSLTRLRAIQLVQSVDAAMKPAEEFEYRELQDLYDSSNNLRPSIYTFIGDTLRAYPSAITGRLNVYFYQNPTVTTTGYNSWIANSYPDEVAMWAAAIVFARTGFAEMAADFQKTHVMPFKEMLLASHLFGTVN